jgi:hypothetical protein
MPVPRTSITNAINNERKFQHTSGMTDPDTIAAIGKQLGAQYVVAGTVTKLGSYNLLVIAILHTETLQQITGDIQTYRNIEEIKDKLPSMARNIAAAVKINTSNLPALAISRVQLSNGVDNQEPDTLTQILAIHLIRSGRYAVYPRTTESLDQVQQEYNNQLNGDVADEYLPNIGRGTNPRLALSVTARRLGSINMFNAGIINLETGIQEAGGSVEYKNLNDGMSAMEGLALRLTGQDWAVPKLGLGEQGSAVKPKTEQTAGKMILTVSNALAFAQAVSAINNDEDGGAYTIILNNSFISSPLAFTGNALKTVTIKGDGTAHVVSNNGSKAFITIPKGITLVLEDGITLNGNGKKGSLVSIEGGAFIMKEGGVICSAKDSGVYVGSAGTFTMEGGQISDNTISPSEADSISAYGGGVYVASNGAFTMKGGTISANSIYSSSPRYYSYGGGVYLAANAVFTMEGGQISDNTTSSPETSQSGSYGGGVYVNSGGTFTMTGGQISGNSVSSFYSYGGGVYVANSGVFSMKGGAISANSIYSPSPRYYSYGGGVYVAEGGIFIKSGASIIDDSNTVTGRAMAGSVVYVANGSKQRNTTAGPNVNLDSHTAGFAGGWQP